MITLLQFVILILWCVVNSITYGSNLRRVRQFDNTDAPSNMTDDQVLGKSFLNCAVICQQKATCITLFVKKIPPMYLCNFSNYTLSDLKDCVNDSDGFRAYETGGTFPFTEQSGQITTVPASTVVTTQTPHNTTPATFTIDEVTDLPDTTDNLTSTSSSEETTQTFVDVTGSEEDGSAENETEEQGPDK